MIRTLEGGATSPPSYVTGTPSNSGIDPLPGSNLRSISRSIGDRVVGFKGYSGDNPCIQWDHLQGKLTSLIGQTVPKRNPLTNQIKQALLKLMISRGGDHVLYKDYHLSIL